MTDHGVRLMRLATIDLENLIGDEEIEKAMKSLQRNESQTRLHQLRNLCPRQLLQRLVLWRVMAHEQGSRKYRPEIEIGRQHLQLVLAVCVHVSAKRLLRSRPKRRLLQSSTKKRIETATRKGLLLNERRTQRRPQLSTNPNPPHSPPNGQKSIAIDTTLPLETAVERARLQKKHYHLPIKVEQRGRTESYTDTLVISAIAYTLLSAYMY